MKHDIYFEKKGHFLEEKGELQNSCMKMEIKKGLHFTLFKVIQPILLLIVITCPGLIIDFTYQGKITWNFAVGVLKYIKSFFKFFGVTYEKIWEFITGNVGVFITLVTIFFTISIDVYERSEKN